MTPTDLLDQKLVAPQTSNGIGVLIAEAFNKAAAPYAPTVGVRFLNVAARLVQENWGVALLDEITASSGRYADLAVLPFQPKIQLTLSAMVSKQRTPSRLTKKFVSIFKAEANRRISELNVLISTEN